MIRTATPIHDRKLCVYVFIVVLVASVRVTGRDWLGMSLDLVNADLLCMVMEEVSFDRLSTLSTY